MTASNLSVTLFETEELLSNFYISHPIYSLRYNKFPPRKWLLKSQLLSLLLWIHMKGTIYALLLNQLLTCGQEEVHFAR